MSTNEQIIDAARAAYLGEDVAAIVAAAEQLGDPVLKALVLEPVAKRKEQLEKWLVNWNSRRVMEAIGADAYVRGGFELLPAKVKEKGLAGKIPLPKLLEAATLAQKEADEKAAAVRRGAQAELKERLLSLHHDRAQAENRPVPEALVMLQDGTLKGFVNYRAAKDWARTQGQAWFIVQLDRLSARYHTDEAQAGAPELAEESAGDAAAEVPAQKAMLDDSGELLPVK